MSKKLENRFKRLSGQLETLQTNISEDADCAEIIPQFLAVKGGLSAAFEVYVKEAIDECPNNDEKKLKNLIRQLTRA